jgi:hypothetical protein
MAGKGFKSVPKTNNDRWDDPIKEDVILIGTKPRVLRFFPYLLELRTHYIEFLSEQKGKTGFPTLCVGWDPIKEQPSGRVCPWCAEMKTVVDKKTKAESQKQRFYQSSAFFGFAFDRGLQKKTKETTVGPVRMTRTLAEKLKALPQSKYHPDMLEAEQIEEMNIDINDLETLPDVTDEKYGFDVTVLRTEKSGKVDYDANPGNTSPLTAAELELFEAYLKSHDIAKMAANGIKSQSNEDIIKSLDRLRDKFMVGADEVAGPSEKKTGTNKSQRMAPVPDDDEEAPRESLTGGGDDDDDDAEAAPPPPKKTATKPATKPVAAKTSAKPRYALDDDDGDDTTSMSNPDPADAPSDDDDEG